MSSFNDCNPDYRERVATFTTIQDVRDYISGGFPDSEWDEKSPEEIEEMVERVSWYIWDECGEPGCNGQKDFYDDDPYFELTPEEYWDLCEGKGKFSYLK